MPHPQRNAVAIALLLPLLANAAPAVELADLSIEDLSNLRVTSVSKRAERLLDAAASVYVITADDIHRSGAATLAEVLRLAPNLQVAQGSNGNFAIGSSRGLNGTASAPPNKLLVLIDGRSVYSPLFAGVFWDTQDVMLSDVARIEVISGPGATLWGVNAFNGVINVITRSASETAGTEVSVRAGGRGSEFGARVGTANWRLSAKLIDLKHSDLASGARVNDAREQQRLAFRADWGPEGDRLTVIANAYTGLSEQPLPGSVSVNGTTLKLGDISATGASLSARWQHALAGGGSVDLQAYLDHSQRIVRPTFAELLDIVDLQFQHTLAATGANRMVWGANLRASHDQEDNSSVIAFLPANLHQKWSSLFAQDEFDLSERLRVTGGLRLEHNDYTGLEVLPTVRMAWKPAPDHAVWGALSRTVRAPSRQDVDAFVPGAAPFLLRGGADVVAEVARVAELGYRGQPTSTFSYSVTALHQRYDHLRTQEVFLKPTRVFYDSNMEGSARGVEMWGMWQASPQWRLSAGLTALHETLQLKPGSNDAAAPLASGRDPAHTLTLRSLHTLGTDKDLELTLRKVGSLANPAVPAYTAFDARFVWRLSRKAEVSLLGQNLNGSHAEYGAIATRADFPRALAIRLVWQN
ncbi:MAG: TonB-dependent receptor [Pseudomonadota bacterium]